MMYLIKWLLITLMCHYPYYANAIYTRAHYHTVKHVTVQLSVSTSSGIAAGTVPPPIVGSMYLAES